VNHSVLGATVLGGLPLLAARHLGGEGPRLVQAVGGRTVDDVSGCPRPDTARSRAVLLRAAGRRDRRCPRTGRRTVAPDLPRAEGSASGRLATRSGVTEADSSVGKHGGLAMNASATGGSRLTRSKVFVAAYGPICRLAVCDLDHPRRGPRVARRKATTRSGQCWSIETRRHDGGPSRRSSIKAASAGSPPRIQRAVPVIPRAGNPGGAARSLRRSCARWRGEPGSWRPGPRPARRPSRSRRRSCRGAACPH
jgi:hypothetical protein